MSSNLSLLSLYPLSLPGGIWTSDRDGKTSNTPCAWDSLITNTTKYVQTFSDFHAAQDTPQYMTRSAVNQYYKSYAEHFQLNQHIQYDTRVIKVRKSPDHELTGKWEVFTCPTSDFHGGDKRVGLAVSQEVLDSCHKEVFDFVLVCSGYFKLPRYPDIPGLDSFPGLVKHSFYYKSGFPYEGKKVMVVGNSFSAGDIANDISLYTDKPVELSIGRGTWICPRVAAGGFSSDRDINRNQLYTESEAATNNRIIANCQRRLDHIGSGINPDVPPTKAPYMMGDDIYLKILTDRIRIKDQLVRFNGSTAEFKSGATTPGLDAVILCTGYSGDISFIDIDVSVDRGRMELYHMMLPVGQKHHTLAFLGFLSGDGAQAQAIELQARYLTRMMTGKLSLPSRKVMKDNVEWIKSFSKLRKGRFHYQVPLLKVCDLIAQDIGAYPSFWRVFLRDPVLAFYVWYGPVFTAQYRLLGPDSDWDAARAVCYRACEVLTSNASTRGKIEVRRDDVTADRWRRVCRVVCGVSLVAVVGFVGQSRNWFQVGLH